MLIPSVEQPPAPAPSSIEEMRRARTELVKRIQLIDARLSSPRRDRQWKQWRERALVAKAHLTARYRSLCDAIRDYERQQANRSEWGLIGELCDHLDDIFADSRMPGPVWNTYCAARERIGDPVMDEEVA